MNEADSAPGGYDCLSTNTGRSALGAPSSPASCPASGPCTGRDKLTGDIDKFADYIWQSTEGAHYLRRVYVSDEGRSWEHADIKWNIGVGGSSAAGGGWNNPTRQLTMQSAYRTCIHDVLHHELGHYLYNLPDRYERSGSYYRGRFGAGTAFNVDGTQRDTNTVMSNNYPHLFVDTTNAIIGIDYTDPATGSAVSGEILTPDLLTDADPSNDGPNRAHHNHTNPFAQDEWSLLPERHVDLAGVHDEGAFPSPGAIPPVEIVFQENGDDTPPPGRVLLLDRSGSMSVVTNGVQAVQFVQEAGMFLYHSSDPTDRVATYLYNGAVEELFPYDLYDPANETCFCQLSQCFRPDGYRWGSRSSDRCIHLGTWRGGSPWERDLPVVGRRPDDRSEPRNTGPRVPQRGASGFIPSRLVGPTRRRWHPFRQARVGARHPCLNRKTVLRSNL